MTKDGAMKKLPTLALILLLAGMLGGCANYRNQSFWEVTKTNVELEADNFQVSRLGIQGTASCPYLFGLGGSCGLPIFGIPFGTPALLEEAMNNLHSKYDIEGKPAFFHNVNIEWTTRGIPLILKIQRVTITADIYEFTKEYRDYKPRN